MRTIYRYEVDLFKPVTHRLMGNPLAVANRDSASAALEFWAEYDPEFEGTAIARTFMVIGTGHPIPASARYWGTAPRKHGMVFHLYELPALALEG
jgi:hypothetical protein